MKSPFRGILGSCPGQCIPANQPTSYTSGPLSRCLDSLPPYHPNSHYNSSLHNRDWWAYAYCVGSMGVTMLWGGKSVSRQEQGESSHRTQCQDSLPGILGVHWGSDVGFSSCAAPTY